MPDNHQRERSSTQRPPSPEMYQDFDGFLRTAVREFHERTGKQRRAQFVALVLASGQALSVARDALSGEGGARKLAIGAASVVALRLAARYLLTGPLALIVTGATVASLAQYLLAHRKKVSAMMTRYREIIDRMHGQYDEIQRGEREKRYDCGERDLMIDGLLKRFLAEVEEG